jgi:uncharacterized protein (DUF305 family)
MTRMKPLNRRTFTIVATVVVAGALALGYAVFSSGPGSSNMPAMTPGSPDGMMDDQPMGSFSSDEPFDLQFIDQMTAHHQGAIVSAANMIADSARPELRTLADEIVTEQTAQVRQMRTWRQQWYPQAPSTFDGMPDEPMGGMDNMMGASGEQRDVMFLHMMIPHHRLAIDMARQALTRAEHPSLERLARDIIADQSAEIRRMQTYLAASSG